MKKDNPFLSKLRTANAVHTFYKDGEKTLVGFSGGADSVSLLHALVCFLGAERVCAVHINHMLRGADADADEAFCKEFCQKYSVSFHSVRVNVKALCGGKGFEETARTIRYQIFEETADAMGCTTVSLAHTASDNLETMIFHLCRGTGASGLSGIPSKRPLGSHTVVRPLLDVTREEILSYAAENALSFRTDATNADTAYTRNFIRAEIVPLFKKINPMAEENARHAAEAVRGLHTLAEKTAADFLSEHQTLPVSALSSLEPAVLYAVLSEAYRRAGGSTLPHAQAEAISALIRKQKTGASVSLSDGITARIDGGILRFSTELSEKPAFLSEVPLVFGENKLSEHQYIYVGVEPAHDFYFSAYTRISEASLPSLFARARADGEAYRFGGMTRKLKKLLCGKTLLEKSRPLICDKDGILWLPGYPVCDGKSGELSIYYIEK